MGSVILRGNLFLKPWMWQQVVLASIWEGPCVCSGSQQSATAFPQAPGGPRSLLPNSGPLHALIPLSGGLAITSLAMTEVSDPPGLPSLDHPYRLCPLSSEGLPQSIIHQNRLSITLIFRYGNANFRRASFSGLCVSFRLWATESPQ